MRAGCQREATFDPTMEPLEIYARRSFGTSCEAACMRLAT